MFEALEKLTKEAISEARTWNNTACATHAVCTILDAHTSAVISLGKMVADQMRVLKSLTDAVIEIRQRIAKLERATEGFQRTPRSDS